MTEYEAVIGLEVHGQLNTRTKMFCGCSTAFGAPPNTHVCPVCLGMPGALPVPNRRAIELAVRVGRALDCELFATSQFARKNYFYPDLAKGYQISQFELPLNGKGELTVELDGSPLAIGITRIHLEEDAAKNMHGVGGETLVDFNRAGVPLMEVVSEPDLRTAAQAEAYLKKLREVFLFCGANDGNLEEGSFRCDANVSIRPVGQARFGTRVELKNINSFRFVRLAIEFEIARQTALIAAGGEVVQETRTYSDARNETISMRGKEEAHDYRYFPDPDLPPLVLPEEMLARVTVPEQADAIRARFVASGLSSGAAMVLTSHPAFARYTDTVIAAGANAKTAANFIQAEVLRHARTDGLEATFPVPAERVAELLALVADGTINGKIAKDVFSQMVTSRRPPAAIIEEQGLAQVTDRGAIAQVVDQVLSDNPSQVAKYREGKTNLLGFFVGQVMKATQGQANPKVVNELLRERL